MIICSCNRISDHHVRACVSAGGDCPRTPADVYRALGHRPCCGRCAATIRDLVTEMGADLGSACGDCAVVTLCEAHVETEEFVLDVVAVESTGPRSAAWAVAAE